MIIYHNPRCGKSRNALQALQSAPCEVVEYLKNPLTVDGLRELSRLLGLKPLEFTRTEEPVYRELFGNTIPTEEALLQAMATHPILMERPIVVIGNKAWIVRSEEAINKIKP